jgi:hypothetical protein
MYKRLIFILIVISILATLFGVAAAPVAKEEKKSVKLVSVGYYHEKGVVFKFKLTGEFKDSELKGSVSVDGKNIKVYCVRKEAGPVNAQCVAASSTSQMAGKEGVIAFAGKSFTFTVPKRNTPK